jgi:hypothetical protein
MPSCLSSLAWMLLIASPQTAEEQKSTGWDLWTQGQQALQKGDSQKAIELFEESLASDSKLVRNYLSLAAAWMDRNNEVKASLYLALYVAAHPEHLAVRFQYIDLLERQKRATEVRLELDTLIAEIQEMDSIPEDQLIHCHSKLMQMGEASENEYEEHLHRGIGLYLLSRQRDMLGKDPEMFCSEGLLCKAAAELTLAARIRADEARPQLYLHAVWSRLRQSQPAGKSLRAAEDAAPFTYLTPAEHRRLQLASRQRDQVASRR